MHKLQQLLDNNRKLVCTLSVGNDGTCHVLLMNQGQIIGRGESIILESAIEKSIARYEMMTAPDPRQEKLGLV